MGEISFDIIGVAHTPYKEKFGIPRQPSLAAAVTGTIEIFSPYDRDEAFREIESFSHVWIHFVFHDITARAWQPMVRPPRLGGNKKVGVFASRSTHRPNPIGLSAVRLQKVSRHKQKLLLHIAGHDLLNQTPIIDIKPYLPYADCLLDASEGYAPVPTLTVRDVQFSADSAATIEQWSSKNGVDLYTQLVQILSQDPRPGYRQGDASNEQDNRQTYGMLLHDLDIRFSIENNCVNVTKVSTD